MDYPTVAATGGEPEGKPSLLFLLVFDVPLWDQFSYCCGRRELSNGEGLLGDTQSQKS